MTGTPATGAAVDGEKDGTKKRRKEKERKYTLQKNTQSGTKTQRSTTSQKQRPMQTKPGKVPYLTN